MTALLECECIDPERCIKPLAGFSCKRQRLFNETSPKPKRIDPECICFGNWRLLVKECAGLFGKKYRDEKGDEYIFYGLVWSDDDLYYGMYRSGSCRLISCVMSLEMAGFTKVNGK